MSEISGQLLEQIRYLEEINRQTMDVLEQAASFGDFWQIQNGSDGCLKLLEALGGRLSKLLHIPLLGFCLLDQDTAEFRLASVVPSERYQELSTIFNRVVDNGLFAWSLKEPKGVLTPPDRDGVSLFIHVISSARGIIGTFLGVLDPTAEPPPYISGSLLTVLLRQAGHTLEGINLYQKLREKSDFLNSLYRIKDEQLAERKKIENWILEILELILTLPLRLLPQAIDHVLSRLCDLYQAKAAGIVFFAEQSGEELCAQAKLLNLPLFYSADYPQLLVALRPHQPFFSASFSELLPVHLLPELEGQLEGCHGALFIPLVQQESTVGFIAAFFENEEMVWRNHVNGLLSIVAQIVMVHLRRSILASKLNESEEKLNHAHKVEALGQMAGGIAHDFNNLLTGIIGFAELIKKKNQAKEPDLERNIDRIITVSKRAANLTKKLVNFSKRVQASQERVNVHETIFDVIAMLGETMDRTIGIRTKLLAENAVIIADPSRVQNVLLNLCINARDAMPNGGLLTVYSSNVYFHESEVIAQELGLKTGHFFCCRVEDTGEGIDDSIRAKLFDPFFTTKGSQRGTGLGLTCVLDTMRDHGGAVAVSSKLGEGSAFSLYFPLAGRSVMNPLYAGKHVCLLGKDTELCKMLAEYLEELGFIVRFQSRHDNENRYSDKRCDLYIVDDPNRDWWEALALNDMRDQRILVLAGCPEVLSHCVEQFTQIAFLKKPFDMLSLRQGLENLFAHCSDV